MWANETVVTRGKKMLNYYNIFDEDFNCETFWKRVMYKQTFTKEEKMQNLIQNKTHMTETMFLFYVE